MIYIIHVYSLLILLIIYAFDTIFLEYLCLRLNFFYCFVSWFRLMYTTFLRGKQLSIGKMNSQAIEKSLYKNGKYFNIKRDLTMSVFVKCYRSDFVKPAAGNGTSLRFVPASSLDLIIFHNFWTFFCTLFTVPLSSTVLLSPNEDSDFFHNQ